MTKKHFMCTHTFVSQEAAKQFISATLELTDRQIFEGLKTEKAEMLAHWRGEESFSSVTGMRKLTTIFLQP